MTWAFVLEIGMPFVRFGNFLIRRDMLGMLKTEAERRARRAVPERS